MTPDTSTLFLSTTSKAVWGQNAQETQHPSPRVDSHLGSSTCGVLAIRLQAAPQAAAAAALLVCTGTSSCRRAEKAAVGTGGTAFVRASATSARVGNQ